MSWRLYRAYAPCSMIDSPVEQQHDVDPVAHLSCSRLCPPHHHCQHLVAHTLIDRFGQTLDCHVNANAGEDSNGEFRMTSLLLDGELKSNVIKLTSFTTSRKSAMFDVVGDVHSIAPQPWCNDIILTPHVTQTPQNLSKVVWVLTL